MCFFSLTGKEARKRELKKVCIDLFVCVQRQEWLGIDVITSCTKIRLLSLYHSCIALFLGVYLGVKTSEVFLCFLATIFLGSFELTSQWLLCIHCFTSLVRFTGFYSEDEPLLVLDVSHLSSSSPKICIVWEFFSIFTHRIRSRERWCEKLC